MKTFKKDPKQFGVPPELQAYYAPSTPKSGQRRIIELIGIIIVILLLAGGAYALLHHSQDSHAPTIPAVPKSQKLP